MVVFNWNKIYREEIRKLKEFVVEKVYTLMKKLAVFLAMFFCLAVLLTQNFTSFAAQEDIIDTSKTGSLTIHKYDITAAEKNGVDLSKYKSTGERNKAAETALSNYVIEGVEFSYVKVADIVTDNRTAGKVQVKYELDPKLMDILNLNKREKLQTAADINNRMKAILTGDNTKAKNSLKRYIEKSNLTRMPLTDKNGIAKKAGIPVALYLVVETKVPANVHYTTDPFFVSVPSTDSKGDKWFYDIDVYPKNQTNYPTLDKYVRQHYDAALYGNLKYDEHATASMGDRVDYAVVTKIPKITDESTYLTKWDFVDTIEKGLSYNKDPEIYFYNTKAEAEANDPSKAIKRWERGSANFRASYTGNQMTVKTTEQGLAAINPELREKYMVLSYSCTLTEDSVLGDRGNDNNVELTWSRTSMNYEDHLKDKTRVYSYGLDLTKTFHSKNKKPDATKVQFVLMNKTDGHFLSAKKVASGTYKVTDNVKGKAEKDGTVFSPDVNGKMNILGLEANEYVLTEIHTSEGYQLLKEPITILIRSTKDNFVSTKTTHYDKVAIANNPNTEIIYLEGERAAAFVNGNRAEMLKSGDSANAQVKMAVVNLEKFEAPMTGDVAKLILPALGLVLGLVGVALMKRKPEEKDEL